MRWREAQSTIYSTPEWAQDFDLQRLEPIDLLAVFEDELRKAEKEAHDARQRTAEEKRRRGRKAREDFVVSPHARCIAYKQCGLNQRSTQALLETLRTEGHIVAGSSWKAIYPLVEADERYHNLLGNPGSSPLDLFWDVVDQLDQLAEEHERRVVQILQERKGATVTEATTYDEFVASLNGDERLAELDHAVIKAVYDKVALVGLRFWSDALTKVVAQLHGREVRHAKEERRKAEKKLRLLVDDLRYAYKKIDPPVDLDSTYEQVRSRFGVARKWR